MNKKIRFITFILIGFFIFIINTFAFEANLQLDKSETDINDYLKLRIEISSSEGGQIGIKEIKGLDNFEKIGQSQSQSSSTNVVMINGKTETKTKTTINVDLTLIAKSKGDFILGPAILDDGKNEIKTNSLKIKVSGDNLFINQNHLKLSSGISNITKQGNNIQQNNNVGNNLQNKKEEKINTYDDVEIKKIDNNNALYLFLGILLITGLGGYFVLKDKTPILNSFPLDEKETTKKEIEKKEIDFNETKKNIVYPEITDTNFINKISEILKQKLQSKFKIKNIDSKSFEEIGHNINDANILELIKLINKAKYSNMIGNNGKILEGIKNI